MAEKKEVQAKAKRSLRACCDVFEDNGNIILRLEMPGVTKDKLDIKVDGNELTIRGARPESQEKDKRGGQVTVPVRTGPSLFKGLKGEGIFFEKNLDIIVLMY